VTAPSRAVADELAGRGPRLEVIAPGVDVGRFAGGAAGTGGGVGTGGAVGSVGAVGSGRAFGTGGAVGTGAPEILVAGALTGWKRPELALEVLARVRLQVPDARLFFAGAPLPADPPGIVAALTRRAEALGVADAVTFAGQVQDMPGALAAATVLLHCAEREPFGIAVLEALAAGRPAVVADAGGTAETVTDACGIRYPPGDAHAAADAIVGLLRDGERAAALGAAGRLRAERTFGLADARARFRTAWRTVAAPRAVADSAAGRLAVVTVTHNSAPELEALLRSVDRHLPGARVVVADAGSDDGSLAVARARPGTDEIELDNVGFGRACNRALASVTEPVTALLNPDVELLDSSLLELVRRGAAVGERERLLAPLVLGSDLARQDSVHPMPLSAAAAAVALIPPGALPGVLAAPLAPWRAPRPRPVGWAVGAALVARTATLRRLGPFDERIFLLGEDLELGVRARRAGVPTWFWPCARVVHHGDHAIGAAHGGEDVAARARARDEAVALVYGRSGARLDRLLQALTFADRLLLKRLAGRSAARERAQLAAVLRVSGSGRRSPSRP
jgi:GT2 family glycosyltransferase